MQKIIKKRLILILCIASLLILGFPLLLYGMDKTFFYGIDPDVVYVTNALLYTKYAIITYADHPGTPTIMLLYYLFIPLRAIAKYILHTNFIHWSFDNFSFLTFYLRTSELALFVGSIFVFLKSVFKISKSREVLTFSWLSVLLMVGLTWGIRVVPENLSFFLTSLWLLIFSAFLKRRNYFLNLLLVIVSGLATANKFTSIFLAVPAIFLPIYIKRLKLDQKFVRFELNIPVFFGSFYLGVLPIAKNLLFIKNWAISLFLHTGTHGTGSESIFNASAYFSSMGSLLRGQHFQVVFIGFTLFLALWLIAKKIVSYADPVAFLLLTTLAGIIVFSKYPVAHYMFVNFILIVFCSAYFVSKLGRQFKKGLIVFLFILLLANIREFAMSTEKDLASKNNDSIYQTLNSWTPYWAADIFRQELNSKGFTKP